MRLTRLMFNNSLAELSPSAGNPLPPQAYCSSRPSIVFWIDEVESCAYTSCHVSDPEPKQQSRPVIPTDIASCEYLCCVYCRCLCRPHRLMRYTRISAAAAAGSLLSPLRHRQYDAAGAGCHGFKRSSVAQGLLRSLLPRLPRPSSEAPAAALWC